MHRDMKVKVDGVAENAIYVKNSERSQGINQDSCDINKAYE